VRVSTVLVAVAGDVLSAMLDMRAEQVTEGSGKAARHALAMAGPTHKAMAQRAGWGARAVTRKKRCARPASLATY